MLSDRELTYFKNRLMRMKQELVETIEANDPLTFEDEGELTSFDNHFADTASQLENREVQFSIHGTAQHILEEINESINRIENGTYGKCVDTGEDIPIDRLEAIPYAKRTLEAQQRFDEERHTSPQTKRSFATPKNDPRDNERIQTLDEMQHEHGHSSHEND